MKAEADLWAAAAVLVREHGADAPIIATQEADAAFERADLDNASQWRIIVGRTNDLLDRAAATRH